MAIIQKYTSENVVIILTPSTLLLQDRQTHLAGRENVWVKDGWGELGYWRLGRVVFSKLQRNFIYPTFPICTGLSRYTTIPKK